MKFISPAITIYETKNDTIVASISALHSEFEKTIPDLKTLSKSCAAAASIVGIARKKENSAAAVRENPISSPPIIVAPDRDIPGKNARHWNRPTIIAHLKVMSLIVATFTALIRDSAYKSNSAPAIKAQATGVGEYSRAFIAFANKTPTTIAGAKPTIIFNHN